MAPIRDLGEQAFEERYRLRSLHRDRALNRFGYVVEHMCSRILTDARSRRSCATSTTSPPRHRAAEQRLADARDERSIILFTGTMAESVRITIEEYGVDRLEPGDVIIANDPYRDGTHVNDLLFMRPVFAGAEIVAS